MSARKNLKDRIAEISDSLGLISPVSWRKEISKIVKEFIEIEEKDYKSLLERLTKLERASEEIDHCLRRIEDRIREEDERRSIDREATDRWNCETF